MSNVKNFTEVGGEKTVIGGQLDILEGGRLTFGDKEIKPAETQASSTATTVVGLLADVNTLIGKLKDAGLMKSV